MDVYICIACVLHPYMYVHVQYIMHVSVYRFLKAQWNCRREWGVPFAEISGSIAFKNDPFLVDRVLVMKKRCSPPWVTGGLDGFSESRVLKGLQAHRGEGPQGRSVGKARPPFLHAFPSDGVCFVFLFPFQGASVLMWFFFCFVFISSQEAVDSQLGFLSVRLTPMYPTTVPCSWYTVGT